MPQNLNSSHINKFLKQRSEQAEGAFEICDEENRIFFIGVVDSSWKSIFVIILLYSWINFNIYDLKFKFWLFSLFSLLFSSKFIVLHIPCMFSIIISLSIVVQLLFGLLFWLLFILILIFSSFVTTFEFVLLLLFELQLPFYTFFVLVLLTESLLLSILYINSSFIISLFSSKLFILLYSTFSKIYKEYSIKFLKESKYLN